MATFAASINCIDGRVQAPVSDWIRKTHGVDFVDVISEPGCDLVLSAPSDAESRIKTKLEISVNAHGSRMVFVSGHHQCAANPVSREEHMGHIRAAMDRIDSWNLPVRVRGLWIGDSWNAEPVE